MFKIGASEVSGSEYVGYKMALKLRSEGVLADSSIAQAEDGYRIVLDGVGEVPLFIPLDLSYDLDPRGYSVHAFFAGGLRESDIYQVYMDSPDGDIRVGWFIPVLALESDLHDYSDNEHFLRYARAAVEASWDTFPQECLICEDVGVGAEGLRFSQVVPESTAFLVISNRAVDSKFDLSRILPAMISFGVLDASQSKGGIEVAPFNRPDGQKLKFRRCAEEFLGDRLINALLSYAVRADGNPVLQFFYLYQVVELLMEKVFVHEQKSIVEKINAAQGAVAKVKEALDDLSDCLSEKKRMNSLINKYCNPIPDLSALVSECRGLGAALDLKHDASLSNSLYPLRNLLFHNYRAFPEQRLADLERVNRSFIRALPCILSCFRYPSLARVS